MLPLHGNSALLLKEDLSSSEGRLCWWNFNRTVDFKGKAQFEFGVGHRFCVKPSANYTKDKYWLYSGPSFSNFTSTLWNWQLVLSGDENLAQIWGPGHGIALWAPLPWLLKGGEHLCYGPIDVELDKDTVLGLRGSAPFWHEPWGLQGVQGHGCWNDIGKKMDRCVRKRTEVGSIPSHHMHPPPE